MTDKRKQPVFEAKLRQIQISTFINESKSGQRFYNTHLVRRYRSSSGEWMSSSSFTGESDLLLAWDLIHRALTFIRSHDLEEVKKTA